MSVSVYHTVPVRYGTVLQALTNIISNILMEAAAAPTDREEIFGKARRLLLYFAEKSVELFSTVTAKSPA